MTHCQFARPIFLKIEWRNSHGTGFAACRLYPAKGPQSHKVHAAFDINTDRSKLSPLSMKAAKAQQHKAWLP
jgi:hypothetical protein